jgi:hypothetical protein
LRRRSWKTPPDAAAEIWQSIEALDVAGPSGYAGFRHGCWLADDDRGKGGANTFRRARGLADEPTSALISCELGRVLLRAGDAAGAVDALRQVVEFAPFMIGLWRWCW